MDRLRFKSKFSMVRFLEEYQDQFVEFYKSYAHVKKIAIMTYLYNGTAYFSELMEHIELQTSTLANLLNSMLDSCLIEKLERGIYALSQDGIDSLEEISESFMNIIYRRDEKLSPYVEIQAQSISQFIEEI